VLRSLGAFFVTILNRWMPDSFVVAIVLSVFTYLLAITVAGYPAADATQAWGDSIWNLLRFTNQIVLTLLLGHVLAHTPPVRRLLMAVAGRVTSARAAYVTTTMVAFVCTYISWGLGLVAGGIMARALGESCRRNGIVIHYPLLVACAYAGFVVFHQGITASIPLTIAEPDHFLVDLIGTIAFTETALAPWSLMIVVVTFLSLPLVMARLAPAPESCEQLPQRLLLEPEENNPGPEPDVHDSDSPAARLEHWRPLNFALVAAALFWLFNHFADNGIFALELNVVNLIFLTAGLALAHSPLQFVQLVSNAARIIGPFLVQYPLYAGIAGVMAVSGLAQMLVDLFVSISSAQTLPFAAFFSAGVLNLFIPSGGGQWAVQGPIMMEAAVQLGADLPLTAMAVALGDQWTNLIQPLVVIPILAIAGLHVRQIMGYMVIALGWTGLIFVSGLAAAIYF
jgi:short-chain fatty acids transporter